jgi:FkbM family methyltransferase
VPTDWPHPVFETFARNGVGPIPNWLGVTTRREFFDPELEFVQLAAPRVDTELFEWIDLLETVVAARGTFTMLELGAGYGRWIVNAAAAARAYHGDIATRLVAVEAEPTHFRWMKRHTRDNGVRARLVHAAVAAEAGHVEFGVGNAAAWYGQAIADGSWSPVRTERVRAITLSSLLEPLDHVDLIHLDVQGAELDVVTEAVDRFDAVRRIHIGTHNRGVEDGLRRLFGRLGWTSTNDYASETTAATPFGELTFQDGVQTWLRPG